MRVAAAVAFVVSLTGTANQQREPVPISVGPVTAVAWPGQIGLATELAEAAARPTDWPGLGPRQPGPLRLIIVPGQRQLDSLTHGRAPPWGSAIALPDARTILLRADDPDVLQTLRHELAHLALHEAISVRVPLWFDEGYAAVAAGEIGRLEALELNLAVVRGAVPELPELDAALRGSATTAEAAYALAASAVMELARRNPTGSLAPLLNRLQAGQDFEASVRATTGLGIGQFEEDWRRGVRRRYSLLTWIAAGGGWGLIVLALYALGYRRRRADRARRAALDVGWEVEPGPAEPEATDGSELDPPRTSV